MIKRIFILVLALVPVTLWAQFAPAQGQPGTTAMHADSSAFVAWATGCVAEPGPMNITNPSAGMAGSGWPASNVIGYPEGTMGVTCLGDGGMATVTFASPICNREGPDFAVFENGFENAQTPGYWFLELGFVEVSSDGEHFFRFPAYSNTQTETQLGGMGCIDPSQIHNLASKYGAMYGTPFELDEVPDDPLLDKDHITHIRIVDVVGCIDPEYATYDCQGHPVNDPWPTPFASGGMDLDAVGVIHDIEHFPPEPDEPPYIANPVQDVVFNEYPQTIQVNLDGVATDPDDPDDQITYSIVTNSNPSALNATMSGKILVMTRQNANQATANLTMRATSDGQPVDFIVHVIMNVVVDEPPYIANPVDDIVFDDFPETIEVNLEGVVTDPDDPDENITYRVISNSNESELSASLLGRLLRLTRLSGEEGEANLVLRAASDGQTIDFEVNVIMHYVYDGIDEKEMETISIYPNPARDIVFVGANNSLPVRRIEVFNVTGQMIISSTETEINVSELESGMYFVRVTADDRMVTRCIMKQ